MDVKITEAIELAVRDARQSPTLATKLIAWLENVTSGNEDIDDQASASRHLELLYEVTRTKRNIEGMF